MAAIWVEWSDVSSGLLSPCFGSTTSVFGERRRGLGSNGGVDNYENCSVNVSRHGHMARLQGLGRGVKRGSFELFCYLLLLHGFVITGELYSSFVVPWLHVLSSSIHLQRRRRNQIAEPSRRKAESKHNLNLSSNLSPSQATSNSLPEERNKINLGRDQARRPLFKKIIFVREQQRINIKILSVEEEQAFNVPFYSRSSALGEIKPRRPSFKKVKSTVHELTKLVHELIKFKWRLNQRRNIRDCNPNNTKLIKYYFVHIF
uniref:Uncharacterized protein n=1 Tax=Beta vulgaris TaxID=161934 RepID=Q0PEL5_BETVU|nr:hypothetical protein [Beta vulgaris]ABM55237.1 hypothetical protein [Beta vulgaris]